MTQTYDVNDRINYLLPWMRYKYKQALNKNHKLQYYSTTITFCRGDEKLTRLIKYSASTDTLSAYII